MESDTSVSSRSLTARYFGFIERRRMSDKVLWHIALAIFIASILFAIVAFNGTYVTSTPTTGGAIVEGVVGTPRFVNPVLAITRPDHDMVALIYSGLVKLDKDGRLSPDIAESVTLSEDGRTYNIKLRDNVHFHNGTTLTARDVAYTIALIQNPELKSPLRGNWDGVLVEELGDFELNIVLKDAYAPFIENLTVGILPRDIWDELPTEQLPFSLNNTEPIGSGPYQITDVLRNKSGLINAYKLSAFSNSSGEPNVSTLVFHFYQNEEQLLTALRKNDIAGTPSLSPKALSELESGTYKIIEEPLPRTFTIFFNQNKSTALRDHAVRDALSTAVDRQVLIDSVLYGFGIPTDSPVPPGFLPVESMGTPSTTPERTGSKIKQATDILESAGWDKNADGLWEKEIDEAPVTLSVTLTTSNTPLFDETAKFIAETWKELGVDVSVNQFEQADLVQAIIRPRDFQALLFGADIGRQVDLYPFWHSSQKEDPGLNISRYTNIDTDALLKTARISQDEAERMEAIRAFEEIVKEDVPAVFLFAPTFGYVLHKDVNTIPFMRLSKPSERFANIAEWHIKTHNLWPIFSTLE